MWTAAATALDPEAALETVNSLINPFDEPMTADDLNIFQK